MHTCGEYTYEDSKLWGKFGIKIFNRFVFRSHSLLSLHHVHFMNSAVKLKINNAGASGGSMEPIDFCRDG